MLEPVDHLRKATMALADRSPTDREIEKVRGDGANLGSVVDEVFEEEAFLDRLREFFNLRLTRNRFCPDGAKKKRKLYGREQACWWDDNPDDGYSCKTGRSDPAAGMFTRWGRKHGHYKNRQGWEKNYWRAPQDEGFGKIWPRGFGTEYLRDSPEALERGLQWLGDRAADDPRFAAQSVRYAYHMVTGEEPMELPTDTGADDYRARLDVYLAQRELLDRVTETFRESDYNFKVAVREIVTSDFFRATRTAGSTDQAPAEAAHVGTSELLTPHQMYRRIVNLMGVSWEYNRGPLLTGKYRVAFGGVESLGSRRPMENPNAVWAGAFKRLTHEVP